MASCTIAVQFIEKRIETHHEQGAGEKAFHMLCRLEKQILRRANVRPLM